MHLVSKKIKKNVLYFSTIYILNAAFSKTGYVSYTYRSACLNVKVKHFHLNARMHSTVTQFKYRHAMLTNCRVQKVAYWPTEAMKYTNVIYISKAAGQCEK